MKPAFRTFSTRSTFGYEGRALGYEGRALCFGGCRPFPIYFIAALFAHGSLGRPVGLCKAVPGAQLLAHQSHVSATVMSRVIL